MRHTPLFKLIQAAFHGDLRGFKRQAKILDMGRGRLRKTVEDVRVEGVPGAEGVGALQMAASNGHMDMCKYLVETMQVDVDDADDEGRTSLLKAVHSGHRGIAQYLLDHGANPDLAIRCGLTPLHSAAGLGLFTINIITDVVKGVRWAAGQWPGVERLAGADATFSDVIGNHMSTAFEDDGDIGSSVFLNSESEEVGANHHVPVNDKPVNRRKIAEFKSLGLEAVEKKDYLSAAGFYSKAMELDPDDATLLSNRSLCWLYMGDGGKALLDAHECRKMRPDWLKACYRHCRSTLVLFCQDYVRACEALFDGFKLDPGNIEIENALRIWKANGIHNGSFSVLEAISKHFV
ncbi:hypothetical protein E2562_020643 [Oryza meyeriana var. granulata]|uniref:Uncharacterized protein n=1 Tax=Oryza meyeriana var. granulata TaxID=110450 RepID=A0A6G1EBI9_9ORYZ|nr:hypothetical protein E2562_020643 [Oryza meyeriana var. granulata]